MGQQNSRTASVRSTASQTRRRAILAGAIAIPLAALSPALAGDAYWDTNADTAGSGATPTGIWGVDAFWTLDPTGSTTPTTAWTANDVAIFAAGADAAGAYTVTVDSTTNGPLLVGGITFEDGAATLSGGQLDLTGATPTINVAAPTAAIGSVLAGTTGLTKTGTGALTLSGVNTFSGTVAIDGGTLSVGADTALGAATNDISINNATLQLTATIGAAELTPNTRNISIAGDATFDLSAGGATWHNGLVAGSGNLVKTGGQTLVLMNPSNTYDGDTIIRGGAIVTRGSGSLGDNPNAVIRLNATTGTATLRLGADYNETRNISIEAAGAQVGASNPDTTVGTLSGVISSTGAFSLTKVNAGTLTLTANNTFSGGLVLNAGVLAFAGETSEVAGSANPLGEAPASAVANGIFVTGGATLRNTTVDTAGLTNFVNPNRGITIGDGTGTDTFNADVADAGTTLNLSSVMTGVGRFAKAGAGTLRITNDTNTHTGRNEINGGKLIISGDSTGAANALGAAPVAATAGNVVFANNGILSTTKVGTAATDLFLAPNRGVSVPATNGTFDLAANGTVLGYSGITAGAGRLTVTASGGGGTLILGGNSTWTGGIKIDSGAIVQVPSITTTALGANPGAYDNDNVILDGGTLRSTAGASGTFINSNRGIQITAAGGILDTSLAAGSVQIYSSLLSKDPGATTAKLTKIGAGDFGYAGGGTGAASKLNTSFTQLEVLEGFFRLRNVVGNNSEVGFGAVPAAVDYDAIILNGGGIGMAFLSADSHLHPNRGITIGANGGTLSNGAGPIFVAGPISGSGKLIITGAQAAVLESAENATTFTGALQADGVTWLPAALNATNLSGNTSGRLRLYTGQPLAVGSDSTDTTYAGGVESNGGSGGTFNKVGTGVLTLSPTAEWAFNGTININAGALKFGTAAMGFSNNATVNIDAAGTLDMNAIPDTLGALNGAGPIINGGNLGFAGDSPLAGNYGGNYSGGGTLTKSGSGSQQLTGSNDFGAVAINGGVLAVISSAALGTSGTNAIAFDGGTLQTTGAVASAGRNATVAAGGGTIDTNGFDSSIGTVTGVGGFTKAGAGTLAATQVKVGGALAVNGGALEVVTDGGATGMVETTALTISGGALRLNDNDLIVNYTGASPETQIRQYVKDGRAVASTSGIFSTPGNPDDDVVLAIADNAAWGKTIFNNVNIDTDTVVGKYTYFGDANLDGKVTGDDYLNVDANLGTGDSWLEGDFNMSGVTTGDDYLAIDANLGKGTANPLAFAELKEEMVAQHVAMFGEEYLVKLAQAEAEGFGASVVPEPAALSIIGLGAVGLIGRRRRSR